MKHILHNLIPFLILTIDLTLHCSNSVTCSTQQCSFAQTVVSSLLSPMSGAFCTVPLRGLCRLKFTLLDTEGVL